jgi:hypothetical protein
MSPADGPPPGGGTRLFRVTHNEAKIKSPSWAPLIPSEFWPYVGQLAVCWGGFENQMNELISALLRATEIDASGWERASFKKRRGMCLKLTAMNFADHPEIIAHIRKAIVVAANVHWRRNLILHGDVTCRVTGTAQRPHVTLEACGRHNGKDRILNYTAGQIEDLFYEVIHATALLRFGPGDLEALRLASRDTQTLRDFAALNCCPPSEATQPHPPQSSGG